MLRAAMRAVVVAACFLSASHFHTSTAAAQGNSALELAWSAPPECPARQVVEALVHAQLSAVEAPTPGQVVASVRVQRNESLFEAELSVANGAYSNQRTLSSTQCDRLAEAVALVISLAFGEADTQAVPPPPVQTPRAAAHPVPARVPDTSAPGATHGARPTLIGAVHTGVVFGSLPHAGMSLDAEVGVGFGRLEVRIGVDVALPVTEYVSGSTEFGGQFDRLAFASRVLVNLVDRSTKVAPYLGVQLGRIQGHGVGISNPETVQASWNALVAGAHISFPLHAWLHAEADARVELPAARYQFEIQGLGAIYTPSAVACALSVGLSARWP